MSGTNPHSEGKSCFPDEDSHGILAVPGLGNPQKLAFWAVLASANRIVTQSSNAWNWHVLGAQQAVQHEIDILSTSSGLPSASYRLRAKFESLNNSHFIIESITNRRP